MKQYIYNGKQYQFADEDVPAGAVPVATVQAAAQAEPVQEKAAPAPKNKGRAVKTK